MSSDFAAAIPLPPSAPPSISASASTSPPQPPSPLATTSISSPTATTSTNSHGALTETATSSTAPLATSSSIETPPSVGPAAAAGPAAAGGPGFAPNSPPSLLHQTLPSADSERHVAEARAAVVASMSNMLDRELQTRASILHSNAAALDKQERDVVAATESLRREREKLAKEADGAARRVKELGNVQNWAEVLERGFLVLEDTVRQANGEATDSEDDDGRSCSCSCSECGGRTEDEMEVDGVENGVDDQGNGKSHDLDGGKLTGGHEEMSPDMLAGTWSDASRSLMEPESSTGTGMAKGSETASLSTTS